jgi:hypothetical protein
LLHPTSRPNDDSFSPTDETYSATYTIKATELSDGYFAGTADLTANWTVQPFLGKDLCQHTVQYFPPPSPSRLTVSATPVNLNTSPTSIRIDTQGGVKMYGTDTIVCPYETYTKTLGDPLPWDGLSDQEIPLTATEHGWSGSLTIVNADSNGTRTWSLTITNEAAPPNNNNNNLTQSGPSFWDYVCSPVGAGGVSYSGSTLGSVYGFAEGGARVAGQFMGGAGIATGVVGIACAATHHASNAFLHDACYGLGVVSTVSGVDALVGFWNPLGWVSAAVSGLTGLGDLIACAGDPPDPNYKAIASPVKLRSPLPRRLPGPSKVVNDVRALAQNVMSIYSTASAMFTSMDRASGARLANDSQWEATQRQYVRSYALRLSRLYYVQIALRHKLVRALAKAGVSNPRLSKSLLHGKKKLIAKYTTQLLTKAGIPAAQRQFLLNGLSSTIRHIRLPRRAFDTIGGTGVASQLRKAARGFHQVATQF